MDTYSKKWVDFHKEYKDKCTKENKTPIDFVKFREFLKKFLTLIAHRIVEKAFIFQMAYGPSNLRIKAWDKHFRFNWDKTLAYFKFQDYRLYKPSPYMQNLRRQKIILANEDPYSKDIVGYVQKKYNKRLDYLRKTYPTNKKENTDEI